MKSHSIVSIISIILVCASFQGANAALAKRDLLVPGDELIIWDIVTNLEWLDLDATIGMSIETLTNGTGDEDYLGEHGLSS